MIHVLTRDRALYYSDDLQLIGLAGKPNSVNDGNVFASGGGPNMRLAGIRKWMANLRLESDD